MKSTLFLQPFVLVLISQIDQYYSDSNAKFWTEYSEYTVLHEQTPFTIASLLVKQQRESAYSNQLSSKEAIIPRGFRSNEVDCLWSGKICNLKFSFWAAS